MILSWELPHTNYTPLKLFPKAKGLPKSVSFFDSPFDRPHLKPMLLIINFYSARRARSQPYVAIKTPAAIAVPITPETFGPIAFMSRKFDGSNSIPTLFETRAAMGTAETPADPISGLIF